MANKRRLALSVAAALALACARIGAQVAAPPAGPDQEAKSFYFKLDAEGNPVFTQVLSWDADPNALEYRLVIRDSSGAEVLDERTDATQRELHLAPGAYEYRIVTYNILGKADAETDWVGFAVIKAEQPRISESRPATIYMDSLDGRITLVGEKLLAEGIASLVPKNGKPPSLGKTIKNQGDEEIVVIFPDRAYEAGEYSISFQNPGGLSASVADALKIRFQRPVDLLFSVGYSPYIALSDSWFTATWDGVFNPLCADAQLELFFVKQRWGFVGIELGADYRRLEGGEDEASILSEYLLAGANALYKYRFTRRLHGLVRLGGGIAWSRHAFDYSGFAGQTAQSADPFIRAGIALQAFTTFKLYGEIGADWSNIYLVGHDSGGITPRLSVGYQLF